jgi:hypothetical protein
MAKATVKKIKALSTSKLGSILRKLLVNCYVWCIEFMVLKFGLCGKLLRKTWEVIKCGSGEGCRRSVGKIV